MSFFDKIRDVFKFRKSELSAKSTYPQKIIKDMILEIEEEINKTTLAVNEAIDKEQELEKHITEARKEQQYWREKTIEAIKAGRDELARKALEKKQIAERNFINLQTLFLLATEQTKKMYKLLDNVKTKSKEAKTKMNKIANENHITSSFSETSKTIFDTFDTRIKELQTKADNLTQLADDNSALAGRVKNFNNNYNIEEELSKMKKELGF